MHIAVLNNSSRVGDADAATMTAAVATQVVHHAAPIWGLRGPTVAFVPGTQPPPGVHVISIVDTLDGAPQGALGYHTEDPGGRQWGVVAASPVLDAGMQVLTGDWSLASVLSHEVLEMLCDPACNLWAADGNGRAYSYEVCDPVEAPTYEVTGVSVSNFVLPTWFDPQASPGAKFDHLGVLQAPFSIAKGGYAVYLEAGAEQQVYGDQFPGWRKAMKEAPTSRTQRRLTQARDLEDA